MLSPGNVATPPAAGTAVVPESVPPPEFVPIASVTVAVKAVAGFLSYIRSITEQLKSVDRWRLILLAVVRAFPLAPAVEGPPLGFKMA